jgi:hypothetical protein
MRTHDSERAALGRERAATESARMQRRTLRAFAEGIAVDPTPREAPGLRDFTNIAPPAAAQTVPSRRRHAATVLHALRTGRKASSALIAALFSAATGLAVYDLYLFLTLVLR